MANKKTDSFGRFFWPVLIAVLVALGVMVVGAIVAGRLLDRQILSSEMSVVGSLFDGRKRALGGFAEDTAWWDEAVQNIYTAPNAQWMAGSMGQTVADTGAIDAVLILDAAGGLIYRYASTPEFPFNDLGQAGLLAVARAVSAAPDDAPGTRTSVHYAAGRLFITGVSAITPNDMAISPFAPGAARPTLAYLAEMDSVTLAALGDDFSIDGLQFSPETPDVDAVLAVTDATGAPVGYLSWQPHRPSVDLQATLQPPWILTVLAFIAFLGFYARGAARLFNEVDNRRRALARHQQALLDISNLSADGNLTSAEVVERSLALAATAVDVDRLRVNHLNDARTALVSFDIYTRAGGVFKRGIIYDPPATLPDFQGGSTAEHVTLFDDQTTDGLSPVVRERIRAAGIAAWLVVPVTVEKETIATISLEMRKRQRVWTDEDRSFAVSLAALFALDLTLGRLGTAVADLEDANAVANAASQAKTDFLAMMSHEIRTPLNGVLGMVDILHREALAPDLADKISLISQSGEDLLQILNDILDLSKVEAGDLNFSEEPFSVTELLKNVERFWRPNFTEKGLTLKVSHRLDDDILLMADVIRIRQILHNLLSNAHKFTETGGADLAAVVTPAEQGRVRLELIVSDTGIGISREAQSRIFEGFVQEDPGISRRYGGTGLGLAITYRLCDLMGGGVSVTSEKGAGSRFTASMLLRPATETDRPVPEEATPDSLLEADSLAGLTVLVAEDIDLNRDILQIMLEAKGARVVFAENGLEALDVAAHQPLDLVLMDIQMPVMDGVAATKKLRASEAGDDILPIIALTANAMQGDRERYLAAGMTGYVAKPVTSAVLMQEIARVLGKDTQAAAIEAAPDAAVADPEAATENGGHAALDTLLDDL